MPEDMPNRMPDRMPEGMPDRMPEDMSDRMPEDMPDRMPEDLPDRMPEDMPEDMPEHMPEYMPDRMPIRMPEDMSDRMPQDLPVRKCINVMVGITRSKVIFPHGIDYWPAIPIGPAEILKVIPFKTWEVAHGWLGCLATRKKNGQHLKEFTVKTWDILGLIKTLMKDDSKS